MVQHERMHPESYNELILDYSRWVDNLPGSVMAVFVPVGGDVPKARSVHREFVTSYAGGEGTAHTPLLYYDPIGHPQAPFRDLS